jgi:hypothetical protein
VTSANPLDSADLKGLAWPGMKIIEVRPCKKFAGGWVAFEGPGVEPAFDGTDPNYAKNRFGGAAGEIHVYDDAGKTIVEKIPINGGTQYGQPSAA